VYADAILNFAWAAVCLAAFAWFIAAERRRRVERRTFRFRAVALALALVSLFPCVSASDDSVRLQFMGMATPAPAGSGSQNVPVPNDPEDKKALGTLVRMLEVLESVQVVVALALSIVLCVFALTVLETHRSLDRFLPARAGRAPPPLELSF